MKFPPEGNKENPYRTVHSKDDELHDERRPTNEPRPARIVAEIFAIIRHFVRHGTAHELPKTLWRNPGALEYSGNTGFSLVWLEPSW